MSGVNYPADWDERRNDVIDRHLGRCVNCRRLETTLYVHHIVPVGRGGSHRRSNLVPLCGRCHDAAHGLAMAPRVRWFTNGELTSDEFTKHMSLWQRMRDRFGYPRFDPEENAIYVPLADADRLMERIAT